MLKFIVTGIFLSGALWGSNPQKRDGDDVVGPTRHTSNVSLFSRHASAVSLSGLDESHNSFSDSATRLPLNIEAFLGKKPLDRIRSGELDLPHKLSDSNRSMQEDTSNDEDIGSIGAEKGSENPESASMGDDAIQERIEEYKEFMVKEVIIPPLLDPFAQTDLERGLALFRHVEEVRLHRSFYDRLTHLSPCAWASYISVCLLGSGIIMMGVMAVTQPP